MLKGVSAVIGAFSNDPQTSVSLRTSRRRACPSDNGTFHASVEYHRKSTIAATRRGLVIPLTRIVADSAVDAPQRILFPSQFRAMPHTSSRCVLEINCVTFEGALSEAEPICHLATLSLTQSQIS